MVSVTYTHAQIHVQAPTYTIYTYTAATRTTTKTNPTQTHAHGYTHARTHTSTHQCTRTQTHTQANKPTPWQAQHRSSRRAVPMIFSSRGRPQSDPEILVRPSISESYLATLPSPVRPCPNFGRPHARSATYASRVHARWPLAIPILVHLLLAGRDEPGPLLRGHKVVLL